MDATLNRGRRTLYEAKLLKAEKAGIMEYFFSYAPYATRDYAVLSSTMPGYEYIQPTEKMYVTDIDLPFAVGDEVVMADSRTMTVKTARYEYSDARAVMGDGRIAWIVTLEGGNA